jgi:hypothetical protein
MTQFCQSLTFADVFQRNFNNGPKNDSDVWKRKHGLCLVCVFCFRMIKTVPGTVHAFYQPVPWLITPDIPLAQTFLTMKIRCQCLILVEHSTIADFHNDPLKDSVSELPTKRNCPTNIVNIPIGTRTLKRS